MIIESKEQQFRLNNFEGPLDLLLHLIRQKKMDILEVSLVEIADQYIQYIEEAQKFNLDIASEYLLTAAQLIEIKSKSMMKSTVMVGEEEYEDAMPPLVHGRDKEIIIICRSGLRSVLATQMLQMMGFKNIASMKTGLRGWNDYELPLYDLEQKQLDPDDVDEMLKAGFCSTLMHPDRRTIMA